MKALEPERIESGVGMCGLCEHPWHEGKCKVGNYSCGCFTLVAP